MELINCGCGRCNEKISPIDKKGRPVRFKKNHTNRGKHHYNWKGGRYEYDGYWYVKRPEHPYCDSRGYVQEHRLVYEHYLSIILDEDVYIPKSYEIHHIIPVKEGGTNNILNLQLLTKSEHTKLERTKNRSNVSCLLCNSNKTLIRKNRNNAIEWYIYKDGYICNRCYMKEYKKNLIQI